MSDSPKVFPVRFDRPALHVGCNKGKAWLWVANGWSIDQAGKVTYYRDNTPILAGWVPAPELTAAISVDDIPPATLEEYYVV
jgi:hypothetical protein